MEIGVRSYKSAIRILNFQYFFFAADDLIFFQGNRSCPCWLSRMRQTGRYAASATSLFFASGFAHGLGGHLPVAW
jgi:hypothetical protein